MAYIGGSPRHEAITGGCQHHEVLKLIGWACPVCNKGNAPDAKTCGHCAKHEPHARIRLRALADEAW